MNKTLSEVRQFVQNVEVSEDEGIVNIIACSYPFLVELSEGFRMAEAPIYVGAQNCHEQPKGAYTGEVSTDMIKSTGAQFVIIGHSERRQYYSEAPFLLRQKVKAALDSGLKVIFCCGESLDQRKEGIAEEVVWNQIENSLKVFNDGEWKSIILAYEPVWAIGTGESATEKEAEEMHSFIRSKLRSSIRESTPILYGGSVKPSNFEGLLRQPNIDGGLIGGASLDPHSFSELSRIAASLHP